MSDKPDAPDNYPETIIFDSYAELQAASNNLALLGNARDDDRLVRYAEIIEQQAEQLERLDNDLEELNGSLQTQGDYAGDYISAADKLREVLKHD